MSQSHEFWMKKALQEAENALSNGEIPVAALIVGNGIEITKAQTQVSKYGGNLAAHAELLAMLELKGKIWEVEHPIIIYTTLEPCLMCLGAAMQINVDEIVFGMQASPDGGSKYRHDIQLGGQKVPSITPHVLESECLALMKTLPKIHPNHGAIDYVNMMLNFYKDNRAWV